LFYATVKEPQRGATDVSNQPAQPNSLRDVLKLLYSTKTFVWLSLASALNVFCIYGLLNWAPSFLQRLHGMTSSDTGTFLGLIYGIGGAIGSFAGGLLTDHFGKKDKRWYLKVPAYAIIIGIPCAAGAIFLQNNSLALTFLGLCAMLQSLYLGPSLSVAHSLVPASMRALTSAVYFLVINLIGLGFGPMIVGMLSDLLKPSLGIESLRWALTIIIFISIISAAFFFNTAKKLTIDLKGKEVVKE
jgi:MFS family permease